MPESKKQKEVREKIDAFCLSWGRTVNFRDKATRTLFAKELARKLFAKEG